MDVNAGRGASLPDVVLRFRFAFEVSEELPTGEYPYALMGKDGSELVNRVSTYRIMAFMPYQSIILLVPNRICYRGGPGMLSREVLRTYHI